MADPENNYDKDSKVQHSRRTRPTQETYRPIYSGRGRGRQDPHVAKALYNFGVTDLRELLNKKHPQNELEKSKLLRRKSKSSERIPNSDKSQTRSKSIERQTVSEKISFIQNPSNIRIELSITTGERNCIIDGDTILADIMHVPDHQFQIQTQKRDIINKNQGEGIRSSFQVVNVKSTEYQGDSEQFERRDKQWKRSSQKWERGDVEQERSSKDSVRGREQWKRIGEQRGRGGQRRERGGKRGGRDEEQWGRGGEQWRKDGEQYEKTGELLERNDQQWERDNLLLQKSGFLRPNYPNIQSGVMRGRRSDFSIEGAKMGTNRGEPKGKNITYRRGRRAHAHRIGQDKISNKNNQVDSETNLDIQPEGNWDLECVEVPVQYIPSEEGKQTVNITFENKYSEKEYAVGDDDANVENLVTQINKNLIITSNTHAQNEKIRIGNDQQSFCQNSKELQEGELRKCETSIDKDIFSSNIENIL